MIFFWNIWDAKEIIAFLRWGSACQLIATSIATILGGLIAAFVGFLASKRIEQRREIVQKNAEHKKAIGYLLAFAEEIDTNILWLKNAKGFPGKEPIDIKEARSIRFLLTATRDFCLPQLVQFLPIVAHYKKEADIPFSEIKEVIQSITRSYNCFDTVNNIREGIQRKNIAESGSIMPIAQAKQYLKGEVLDGTIEEAEPTTALIKELIEKVN